MDVMGNEENADENDKSVVRPTVVEIVRTLGSDATNQNVILNPTIAKKRKVPKSAKPIVVERK